MELDAFTARLGVGQGRIEPTNAIPLSGDYVFVLGEDEPDRFFELAPGDYAEVVQDVDLTEHDLVRTNLHLRVPASLQAEYEWKVAIIVDGSKLAKATCLAGRERNITDLAANVSKMTGVHQVGVRLELMEI